MAPRRSKYTKVPPILTIIAVALSVPYRKTQFLAAEVRERDHANGGSPLQLKRMQVGVIFSIEKIASAILFLAFAHAAGVLCGEQ